MKRGQRTYGDLAAYSNGLACQRLADSAHAGQTTAAVDAGLARAAPAALKSEAFGKAFTFKPWDSAQVLAKGRG